MSAIKEQWAQWTAKFAALTRRERAIVSAAVVLGGGYLIFSLGLDPLLAKARTASRAEAAARSDIAQQESVLATLKAKNADPDAANRARLEQVRQSMAGVGERLAKFEAGMVPPEKMKAFLEGLLARNRGIEILGLKTLPVTQVGTPAVPDKAAAAPAAGAPNAAAPARPAPDPAAASDGIYQHGIEIRMAGSYNDLLNYLADLERMPQRVMWNSVSLSVDKHPRNVMVLRVYTLSLDRNWLIV